MKKYELFLVLPGTLDENETAQKTGEIIEIINEFGQNAEIKPMGKNRLAYPIKQVRYGYFYTIYFDADAENIKKIEDKMRLTRGLLRSNIYLFNKASEGAEKISFFSQTSTLVEPTAEGEIEAVETAEIEKTENQEKTEENAEETTTDSTAEKEVEEKIVKAPSSKAQKIDLKEIDKKLDEILSDEDINI